MLDLGSRKIMTLRSTAVMAAGASKSAFKPHRDLILNN